MLIWLVAGLGLGVFLTMAALMLVVAADRRAFRRRLRLAALRPAPVAAPSRTAIVAKARPAPASPVVAPAGDASPTAIAPETPPAVAPSSPEVEVASLRAAGGSDAPAAAPEPQITATPVKVEPVLSVEEMFARAFEAGVPTVSTDKPQV